MKRSFTGLAFALLLAAMLLDIPALSAGAQGATRLRIATLAPTSSRFGDVYRTMDRGLREQTSNRVSVQVFGGGAAGDERLVVRKMRVGQLDGAALTTTGLGLIAPQVLALQAPGLIETYTQLDAVRAALEGEFEQIFDRAGYKLVGWGDAGELRMFSQKRIARPSDLRSARPWVWRDSPLMIESVRQAGANGVPLGVPEVYPGLQTGMIDTVTASALTAIGFQWHNRLCTMTQQAGGVIIGALVIRKEVFEALPDDAKAYILETARDTQGDLRNLTRRMDRDAYRELSRRLEVVDTDPHRAEWEAVGLRAREALAGRVYPRELMQRVEAIVRRHPRR
ncbi:MAG: TRAP transporter substrate-binding protein DctP [Polyangiaceae bacterium]|nr:TRAP transporter substrate-binding protein DctP [Polyangiaceae bacterium]